MRRGCRACVMRFVGASCSPRRSWHPLADVHPQRRILLVVDAKRIHVAQSDKAWPGHSVFSRAPALPSSP